MPPTKRRISRKVFRQVVAEWQAGEFSHLQRGEPTTDRDDAEAILNTEIMNLARTAAQSAERLIKIQFYGYDPHYKLPDEEPGEYRRRLLADLRWRRSAAAALRWLKRKLPPRPELPKSNLFD